MNCKECDNPKHEARRSTPVVCLVLTAWPLVCAAAPPRTVRMWPSAVVVDDQVRLGDLCELIGFAAETHEQLRNTVVVPSPPPGGSKAITLRDLCGVLTGAGINMAETIVKGAAECGVSRPRVLPLTPGSGTAGTAAEHLEEGPMSPAPATLRDAVVGYFREELSRYEGRVQVDFGRAAVMWLDLAGPEYAFEVRRRANRPLGLIDVEVDVLRDGQRAQQLELQPVVSLARKVAVARRAINHKAEIRPKDVHLVEITFERLDRLGITDLARVIGQRAKKFVSPGAMLSARELETVPLVKRGQLVTVRSTTRRVVVETAAKALESGGYGDAVELRDAKRRGRRLIGVVTGPRQVELRGDATTVKADSDGLLASAGGNR
ncbi:MAG: flagellar basal body P-ring formation chaperone FlgA [Planctomycetota bacterium]